jgi:hypothetical protein
LIDDVVSIGIDEFPQNHAVGTLDDPPHMAVDLLGHDLALGSDFRTGPIIIDPGLDRREFQGLLDRGRGRPRRARQQC